VSQPEGSPNQRSWRKTRRWLLVAIIFGALALLFAILGLVGTPSVGHLVQLVCWAIYVIAFSLVVRREDRRRR
jgi:membrane protein implicated in regulation of membrane protease activity